MGVGGIGRLESKLRLHVGCQDYAQFRDIGVADLQFGKCYTIYDAYQLAIERQ